MVKQTGLICAALFSSMLLSVKSAEAKPSSTIKNSDISTAQAAPAAPKPISAEKKLLLRQLDEISGGKKQYEQIQQLMAAQMEQQYSSISGRSDGLDVSKFIKEFGEKFTYEDMLEKVIFPTYDQYFTETDIKGMIAFYKTPTGEKVISVTPQLTQTIFKRTFDVLTPYLTEITNRMKK
jgi:hypothetical protein